MPPGSLDTPKISTGLLPYSTEAIRPVVFDSRHRSLSQPPLDAARVSVQVPADALWPRGSGGTDFSLNYQLWALSLQYYDSDVESLALLIKMADGDKATSSVLTLPRWKVAAFAAMAEMRPPGLWAFSDFHRKVTSPKSPLYAFISGVVRDISYCFDRWDYLILCVHFQNEGVPIVWLRLETRGNDVGIRFSTDRSKLRYQNNDDIMVTTFATLNFRPVLDLLHNVLTNAMLAPMWISTVIGILHGGFGGSWVKPPLSKLLPHTLKFFIRHAAAIESVQRQFAIQYPNTKKVSLAEPEAWKNEPASLSQPPSSKQDSREGPDSKLAGTKGKIAYIGSASRLSEEHLPGPRAMQSPNMNGEVADAVTDAEKNGGVRPRGPRARKNPLSGQTDGRRAVQPANPSSTPTSKDVSARIDEATSILQGLVIAAPSAEVLGQASQTSLSFPNPQPSPPETPNLTGRIVRLGTTPIAMGGYSSVWRGSLLSAASDDPDQALQVAIKVLRASYTDEDTLKRKLHERLHVEMRIWSQLHHENVVRLLGHTEEPEGPGLVSISYPHGNVLGFLAKNPSVNREVICADVALGLQYLHGHKPRIIHGDLKGPNVLIDGEGRASICDFGLSIILDGSPTGHTSSNFGGSLRFLAPELLEETTRTVETDIYAYACTCIAILFDREPYHELEREAHLMRAILNHQPPFEPSNEEATLPSFWRILKRCWDHERMSRPSLNLIIIAIQLCLYCTYRTNMGIREGIGRRVRFMYLPGIEEAKLISVADDGLSIVVNSSSSFHRVPIYQRYRWELMDRPSLKDPENEDVPWLHTADDQDSPFTSLSGKFASSSETPYVSKWKDYSAKFRLLYSLMVSYEPYKEAASGTA